MSWWRKIVRNWVHESIILEGGVVVVRGYQWSKSQLLWLISWVWQGALPLFCWGSIDFCLIGKRQMSWPSYLWLEGLSSRREGRDICFWTLDPIGGFCCSSYFCHLLDPFPFSESIFSSLWNVKVPKKVKFFVWKVIHGRVNPLYWRKIKMVSLFVLFCCVLRRGRRKTWIVLFGIVLLLGLFSQACLVSRASPSTVWVLLVCLVLSYLDIEIVGDDQEVLSPSIVSRERKIFVVS